MLTSSKKQKGKKLEREVAKYFSEIFAFAYSRADSGSGLNHKEDVTLPDSARFHIECKNQAELSIKSWWDQTLEGCPANKLPVLIYRLNYQKGMTVVMRFGDLVKYIGKMNPDLVLFPYLTSLEFSDFIQIVREVEAKNQNAIV